MFLRPGVRVSKSKAKGTAGETAVVRYLQQWWPATERRALNGGKDRGDIAGIADLCIEVKAAKTQLIGPWQRETLTEMANAGASACLLVVKRPYKAVGQWDAYMPIGQLGVSGTHVAAGGDFSWVRMDFRAAALLLRQQGL
jgi:hypothetical protein